MSLLARFIRWEAASGVVLIVATIFALAWANSPASLHYEALCHAHLRIGSHDISLMHAVNDGLMVIFFLLVGLEIKRELLVGELASVKKAALPIAGAIGGMVVPAAIYLVVVTIAGDTTHRRGWAVPMATDIAFALGVLSLLGSRVPASLRVFLAALAIADDLGAVMVIALFYAGALSMPALIAAVVLLAGLVALNRLGVRYLLPYLIVGVGLWVAVLMSGIHATIAGVLLAATIPVSGPHSLLERLQHALQPWVAFAIMPIFAFVNAGVRVVGGEHGSMLSPVPLGIGLGLLLGKQLGVFGAVVAVVKLGWATLPSGATWRQTYAVACLCGIGFTMSLFVASLAFVSAADLEAAKLAILAASAVAAGAGAGVLLVAERSPSPLPSPAGPGEGTVV